VATKAEARARAASWKRAIAEGRVVRFAEGQTFREYSTPEAAHRAAAEAAPELRATIVRGPEMEHNQAWEGDYVITELDHPGAWNVLYVDRSGNYREILPNLLHDKNVALNFLRDHAREAGAFHAVIFEERAVGDLWQIGNFVEGRLQMTANAHRPLAVSGTAYQFEGLDWRRSTDEDWETVMYSPYGERVRFVGERVIDGSPVHVWRAGPMRFIAQLAHMSPNAEPPPPPRRRRAADPSLRRVRQIVESEERPFEPERRYPRETKPHHFVVNAGLEQWREPDEASEYSAVWYGPGGRAEAEQATEIEGTAGGWYVREYQHLEGYVDEFDPDEPFLVTETHVSLSETLSALDEGGVAEPDDPIELMRYAVAFGVADLAERGGSESYASELP